MGHADGERSGALIGIRSLTGVVAALVIIAALLLFYVIWIRGGDPGTRLLLPFLPFDSPI